MNARLLWRRMSQDIWFPVALYGAAGVLTALLAALLQDQLPVRPAIRVAGQSVEELLKILASSMLATTTFSVSIMLAAFSSASNGATPRATQLLKGDAKTQRVLATFIGAFIFSLVSLIALKSGIYTDEGRTILFFVTIMVFALIVFNLMRWIKHLTEYGRLSDTIARLEEAATAALVERAESPHLGGRPLAEWSNEGHERAIGVKPKAVGYVQLIDMEALQSIAASNGWRIAVVALPGAFVHLASDLARIIADDDADIADDAAIAAIRSSFHVDTSRSYEQDPRFGIITLSEVGQRALSPAVNDPGTAIDIIGRMVRVLSNWPRSGEVTPRHDRVFVQDLSCADVFDDAFTPIARDGAALFEVQVRLQKALLALAETRPGEFAEPALAQSRKSAARAKEALAIAADRLEIEKLAAALEEFALSNAVFSVDGGATSKRS